MIFNSTVLFFAVWLLMADNVPAITFTNLYDFTADSFSAGPNPQATNGDGVNPEGFVLAGNTIYGTAYGGGMYGYGTVFRINTDGTLFTNLFNFNQGSYDAQTGTYPDNTGEMPNPGLLLISNTLYGTTFSGGQLLAGTVFKINTDGSDFGTVFSFSYTNGQGPSDGLTLYGNALYGTTAGGGTNGYGTVFKINLNDLSFATIYQFASQINPYGGVVLSSNAIYGFGEYGGTSNDGCVYRISAGSYADLFDFNGVNGAASWSTPILSGNTLYGVTYQGGTNGSGNVFRINTDGQDYTNLYNFTPPNGANVDGAYPYDFAGLVLSGNILYGATSNRGSGGQGTVFQLNTDGTGFAILHSFQYTDGSQPEAVALANGTLYGVAIYGIQGGSLGDGGIFALVLQPTLNIGLNPSHAVLTWNDPSYFLYSTPTLANAFTKIAGATSPYTNTITGGQMFFRLQAN